MGTDNKNWSIQEAVGGWIVNSNQMIDGCHTYQALVFTNLEELITYITNQINNEEGQ